MNIHKSQLFHVKQTWFYNEFYIGIHGEAAVNLLAWYPRELDAAVAVV